jgi:hypothetical protein
MVRSESNKYSTQKMNRGLVTIRFKNCLSFLKKCNIATAKKLSAAAIVAPIDVAQ